LRITSIEARSYVIPLDPPFHAAWDPRPRTSFAETVVTVHTDQGVAGHAGGAPVPDLETIATHLVGRDIESLDEVTDVLATIDFHGGRNWTVDVAVHDAAARAAGLPLWQYLGGSTGTMSAYASSGQRLPTAERVRRSISWAEAGIGALKLRFHHDDWREDVDVVAAVRGAIGDGVEVLVDANHGWRMPGDLAQPWDPSTAAECARALGDLGVYWLEEPLPMDDPAALADLRSISPVPIAGGEMVRTLTATARLIEAEALDIVQNDVVLAGGIAGARRVSEWAARKGAAWSPHTWSTGYGLLANLHAALAFSSVDLIEVPFDPPEWSPERRDFMLPEPLGVAPDGTITPPKGPGLGVEPDWKALEQYRVAG
jgi:D-galactarolactone cycloisomerase